MKKLILSIIILFSGCPIGTILFANHTIAVDWPIEDRFFKLNKSPNLFDKIGSEILMSFPTPSGHKKEFYMYKSPVMPDQLAITYPDIKTYTGVGIDDPSELVSLTLHNGKAIAMIYSSEGNIFISKDRDSDLYRISYNELGYKDAPL